MMRNGHSSEFWTLSTGNLKCKSLFCDFDVSVVYEIVAYDMGKLSVCSKCAYDKLVTCTCASGHFAVYEI